MKSRLPSIDCVRGIAMVLMALDHVRMFLHADAADYDPLNIAATLPELFVTRWITHFCAPIFVFLAGTSIYLSSLKKGPPARPSVFLLKRGLWLVALELTIIHLSWNFNFDFSVVYGQVIWAIGWCMVAMAFIVGAQANRVLGVGAVLLFLHNLTDGLQAADLGRADWLVAILFTGDSFLIGESLKFAPKYPLVPWFAIMAIGYGAGRLFLLEPAPRRRLLAKAGAGLILGFVVLRALNSYGDPHPWKPFGYWLYSLASFLNCEKYPPSLLFTLVTLGPSLLMLAALDGKSGRWVRPLILFGQVPLFYYVLHIPLIHAFSIVLGALRHLPLVQRLHPTLLLEDGRYGLPTVYAVWILSVLLLYPACRWFAKVKADHPSGWLRYL